MESDGRSVSCKTTGAKSTVAAGSSHFDIAFA